MKKKQAIKSPVFSMSSLLLLIDAEKEFVTLCRIIKDELWQKERQIVGSLHLQYNDGGYVPEGAGLLISILLRYPEVGTIYYWQEKHALQFAFLIKDQVDNQFAFNLEPALEVFHDLEGTEMEVCAIETRQEEQVAILTITRDVNTMTRSEVGLIVEMVKSKFANRLVYDETYLPEDELMFQEELIGHMLATVSTDGIDKNVVAVREEGRVIVFNN